MHADVPSRQSEPRSRAVTLFLRPLLQVTILCLALAALIFIPAGRAHLDWGMAWALLVAYSTALLVTFILLGLRDPSLARERAAIAPGAKRWDVRLINLFNALAYVVMPPLAGLDRRFGWSPSLPFVVQLAALGVFLLGFGLFDWAMLSNRFFSGVVRIQEERGHVVCTGGPYRFVRHPGYVGMILMFVSPPIVLGSLWALIPCGLAAALTVVRAVLEDRTLHEELSGYKEYAQRVRYRLLPGVW